ncbi:branched-chain amino acid ABC transporter permease [Arthrobacter sp. TB 23]|uniref:branched-chain amino acid ABC transporter permease n=1 Tax=Arthrobacter sp. TB 23 TaxID=494419 RepID=UPI0002EA5A17|nr:branched-chain amino acid ABC transporter permease [Arthrobacter sp. TB 23]
MKRSNLIIGAVVVALLALLPLVIDQYLLNNAVLIVMFVGITVAWNIAAFGGALSLGHAAFFGLGSYTMAILLLDYGVNPWLGMLAGMVVAAGGGLLLSIPLLRLRGPFFTLASLAFVEVIRLLSVFARDFTGGSEGLTIPYQPGWLNMSFSDREPYYYIVLGLTILAVLVSIKIYYSRMGYQLRASGSDDEATRALGVNTAVLKVLALVVSAALTGAFGAFAAQYFFIVDPETNFSLNLYSIQPALNGIIGGAGTVLGPILGAVLMTPIGEYMRSAFAGQQGLNFMIYGVVLVAVVMLMPGGLVSGIEKLRARFRRNRGDDRLTDDTSVVDEQPEKVVEEPREKDQL